MTVQGLLLAFVVCGSAAFLVTLGMFLRTVSDLHLLNRTGQNGPMRFMVTDNLRDQGLSFGMASIAIAVSVLTMRALTFETKLVSLLFGFILVAALISVKSVLRFRRRSRMARLVQQYGGVPGGKRKTDPPV